MNFSSLPTLNKQQKKKLKRHNYALAFHGHDASDDEMAENETFTKSNEKFIFAFFSSSSWDESERGIIWSWPFYSRNAPKVSCTESQKCIIAYLQSEENKPKLHLLHFFMLIYFKLWSFSSHRAWIFAFGEFHITKVVELWFFFYFYCASAFTNNNKKWNKSRKKLCVES